MGAYFRIYKNGRIIKKTLIRKRGGSLYPTIDEFKDKISLLQKYMGNFLIDTDITYDGQYIRIEQPFIKGDDIFEFIKVKRPKDLSEFLKRLSNFYFETGIIIDLINDNNILVTKDNEIKIVDIWPLFFKGRVKNGDVSEESFEENLQRFNFLIKSEVRPL